MDPRYGTWDPSSGTYRMNVPLMDQEKWPVKDPNYNPFDQTWKYYTEQKGNTYQILNPAQRNDKDWAATSAITPQGSNINDAWSTSPGWRPEAPTGGLYGAYQDLAQAGPSNDAEATQEDIATQFATGKRGGLEDQNVMALGKAWVDLYDNPGYSKEAQRAMQQDAMDAGRAAAGVNTGQIMSMARRTNNPMAAYGALADVSRGESSALGEAARKNVVDQENAKRADQQTARQGFTGFLSDAYGRQGQGLAALGQSNKQLLDRRAAGIAGQQKLYDQQGTEQDSLLKQLQSLFSTRQEDNTQLGKTTGSGGLWA